MSDAYWVITTFLFLATTVIVVLITLSFWYLMKPEGRFFYKRSWDKTGIDVIRHEPLSNRLRLITVKWNGKYFQHGKEMIFFGIETLLNPKTEPQKYFNEVVARMCSWAGSKRPVLIATDIMSHLLTADLLALVAKTKKNTEYEKVDETFLTKLKTKIKKDNEDVEPEIVTYMETMKPDDLTEFMEDISARQALELFEIGKRVNELDRARGFQLPGAGTIVVSVAAIGLVIIIAYLVMSGRLNEIISTFQT